MNKSVEEIVFGLKQEIVEGVCINLVPLTEKEAAKVVELRNKDKNKYFLNQSYELTVEGQLQWIEEYKKREDDIYWCVYNKNDNFVGTIRIYDIAKDRKLCDLGSFMIDENYSGEAPYAIEALIMAIDIAFERLGITEIINEDRCDNKVMNSLSKKLGFSFVKEVEINGVPYNYYLLSNEAYMKKREKFYSVIKFWGNR